MKYRVLFALFVFVLLASTAVSVLATAVPSSPLSAPRLPQAGDQAQTFLPMLLRPRPLPAFKHVYIIVMENQFYTSIVGNTTAAPYINNTLIPTYALATNYQALFHPSQPNYMALFSGSNQGVVDDNLYNVNAANLADQIEAAGKTWHFYAEDFPGNCNLTLAVGEYARRHVPALNFLNITTNPTRCANITDLTSFDPAAANYEFITPNLIDDMHDGGAQAISNGDTWLSTWVSTNILNSAAWLDGGVLFIVWDEDASPSPSVPGGGQVPLIIAAPNLIRPGYQSGVSYNHYSLLWTIQKSLGLPCLANSCGQNDLAEFFQIPVADASR